MFKRWKTKKQEATSPVQSAEGLRESNLLDNASMMPRASDVTAADQSTRSKVRRDIQSHIPDWIDDVVHAQLVQIAERLATEARGPAVEDPWTPTLPESEEGRMAEASRVSQEEQLWEDERPGSAPSTIRDQTYDDSGETILPRRSSVSAPSTRSLLLYAGARSLISPVEPFERPYSAIAEVEHADRHSRNLSSSSGDSMSHGAGTSVYSKRSSVTSPGTSTENRISDQLSHRMTWKDIATRTGPIKKPVQAGLLKKVNTHLAKPSTTYSIMSPVNAGVFDEVKLHVSKPSTSYSILSPVLAGVFDDPRASINKPLPPDPRRQMEAKRTTFFVVGEAVHSPRTDGMPALTPRAETLRSPLGKGSPKPGRKTETLRGPANEHPSPSTPGSEKLLSPVPELPSTPVSATAPQDMAAKQFARLSRPFMEPIYDLDFSDAPSSVGDSEGDRNCMSPDLTEKIVVLPEDEAAEAIEIRIASPVPSIRASEIVEDNAEAFTQDEHNNSTPDQLDNMTSITAQEHHDDRAPAQTEGQAEINAPHTEANLAPDHVDDETEVATQEQRGDATPDQVLEEVTRASVDDTAMAPERAATPIVTQKTKELEELVAMDDVSSDYADSEVDMEERTQEREALTPTPTFPVHDSDPIEEESAPEAEDVENEALRQEREALTPTPSHPYRDSEVEDQEPAADAEEEADDNASVTLSQAEDELMAQLCLDTSHKFMRPESWLADSPTLGSPTFNPPAVSPTNNTPAVPVLRVDSAQATTPVTDAATPVTDATTPVTEEQAAALKKKTQSYYEFLWSPDGWYVA